MLGLLQLGVYLKQKLPNIKYCTYDIFSQANKPTKL